ncbi:hypothetical protein A6A29_26505 [Streptomyces sp. TSRI0281]|nr:hypothetical protein A6A29_26505 [Streptomyces sp. TSRI0281]
MTRTPARPLNDGRTLPAVGLGTWLLDDDAAEKAVAGALGLGHRLAAAHGVTPGQVVLRWHTQLGAVPIPKSADPGRQRENLDLFGFELTPREMARVAAGPQRRFGGDPDVHEEF